MGSSVSEFVVDGGFEISKYFACCFPVCFPWVWEKQARHVMENAMSGCVLRVMYKRELIISKYGSVFMCVMSSGFVGDILLVSEVPC